MTCQHVDATSLRDAAIKSGVSAEEFDKIDVAAQMVGNLHKNLGFRLA